MLEMSTKLGVNDHQTQGNDWKEMFFSTMCGNDGLEEVTHIILNTDSETDLYARYVDYKLLPGTREILLRALMVEQ